MYIVTGGAGFIGSAIIWQLNRRGIDDILIVDRLGTGEKWRNLVNLRFRDVIHKDAFLDRLESGELTGLSKVEAILHMGACSATTETDADYLMSNNVHYTRRLADWALKREVRFVYASSAATYGDGSQGFDDDDDNTRRLQPMNMYGYSKHLFDLHALREGLTDRVVGLKFFNVFGPNEYHKGSMASMIYHAYQQISRTGKIRLFRSTTPEYADGGQMRDFVYVKDAVEVVLWFLDHPEIGGIYNVGTGRARSWNELAAAVFAALQEAPAIEYIDMPQALAGKYQNFTEASMNKLRAAGCGAEFRPLEASVEDYVVHYLASPNAYL